MKPKYFTDNNIKQKIDVILIECATIFSNLGTGTPFDLKTKDKALQKESELLCKIKEIDEQFYMDRLSIKKTCDE